MKISDEKINELLAGCEGVTQGPWAWTIYDYSLAALGFGDDPGINPDSDLILNVSPCSFCSDASEKEWEWGRCTTPLQVDAEHIARCDPDTIRALCNEVLRLRSEASS